ncbi:MAG: LysE family transporter [Pseudomonadota bacterium]
MVIFATAVFFLIITPGPGVLSIAGVGAAFGPRAGTRYLIGLFIGTNLVTLAVVSGLTAAILADAQLRALLFVASIAYLAYLASRIAFAGSKLAFIERAAAPGILGGITLQVINPKAYAVNTALFSGFGFIPQNYTLEILLKVLIMNAIWIPIHFGWLWLGIAVRRMNLSARRQRVINMAMAGSMLMVVLLAAWAEF